MAARAFLSTLLLCVHIAVGFFALHRYDFYRQPTAVRHRLAVSNEKNDESPLSSDFKRTSDGSYADRSSVDFILSEIKDILSSKSAIVTTNTDDSIKGTTIERQFEVLLSQLNTKDVMSSKTELLLLKQDIERGEVQDIGVYTSRKSLPSLPDKPFTTSIYSISCAPYCIVYGDGPVGQSLLQRLKDLEPAVKLKKINAKSLLTVQPSELSFALRDVKTIIIAADPVTPKSSGWFAEPPSPVLDKDSLRRLLNAAMKEQNMGVNGKVKVVILGRASVEKKGLASILLSGDAGTFENDAVLQCQARGLDYAVIKVGNVIDENEAFPKGLRDRSPLPMVDDAERAIAFTLHTVEASEVTRVSVAAEVNSFHSSNFIQYQDLGAFASSYYSITE